MSASEVTIRWSWWGRGLPRCILLIHGFGGDLIGFGFGSGFCFSSIWLAAAGVIDGDSVSCSCDFYRVTTNYN